MARPWVARYMACVSISAPPICHAMTTRHIKLGAAIVAVIATGAFGFNLIESFGRHPDRGLLDELWRQGRYFTLLTTSLVAMGFAFIAITGRVSARWGTALAYWSAIVGVVYHTLLARDLSGARWWADQGLHTVVPLAVAIWWLLCAPKRGLVWHDAMIWLIWPGIYVVYVLIRGEMDGLHPYFFVDPPLIGWPKVGIWCAALALVFWGTGMCIIWACRFARPDRPHRADDGPDDLRPRSPINQGQRISGG